jgi:hypothetical protein
MKTIVIEVPHQTHPKVTSWDGIDSLLDWMRTKSRLCESVGWRVVTSADLESEYDGDPIPADASALFAAGCTEIVERSNQNVTQYSAKADDDGEINWYCEHQYGDNKWYWLGSEEEVKTVRLPEHQRIATQIELDSVMSRHRQGGGALLVG